MLKALVIKELRESAGVLVLAVLAAIYVVVGLMGFSLLPIAQSGIAQYGVPFVSDSFQFYLAVIVGGLAAALGLKQAAWEFGHSTYHFLLHRPVRRGSVFWTKLAVGVSLVLVLGASMILLYALWAQSPGRSAAPFFWSMTVPAWQCLLCLCLVYLGAFLSGLRPARWFGTRLAPGLAGFVLAMVIYAAPWWWLAVVGVVVSAWVILVAIFYYAAERDY